MPGTALSKWPTFAGAVSFLLGFIVVVGWLFRLPVLVQVHPSYPAMHIHTALEFMATGAGLWWSVNPRHRMPWILVLAAASIPALTLAQFVFQVDWGIQRIVPSLLPSGNPIPFAPMTPYTAFSFMIFWMGLALLTRYRGNRWAHFLATALGSMVFVIGAMNDFGYAGGLDALKLWAVFARMALHTAMGFTVIAAGLVGLALQSGVPGKKPFTGRYVPVLGVGLVTATLLMTLALLDQNRFFTQRLVDVTTQELKRRFLSELGGYQGIVERMSLRRSLYGKSSLGSSYKELEANQDQFPALIGFSWVEKSGVLNGTVSKSGISLQSLQFADGETLPAKFLDPLGEKVSVVASGGNEKVLLLTKPWHDSLGTHSGFLVCVVSVPKFLQGVSYPGVEEGYKWIFDEGQVPLSSVSRSDLPNRYCREDRFGWSGNNWGILACPKTETLTFLVSPLPRILLASGLIFSLLLSFTALLLQFNHERTRQLRLANAELREQRDRIQESVTAQREAETASRKHQELLSTVLTNAPIILFMLDEEFHFQLSIGKGLELLGLKENESVGKSARGQYASLPSFLEALDKVQRGLSAEYTTSLQGREFQGFLSPIRNGDGNFGGVIGVSLDVTEGKQAERALRTSEERFRALIQNSHDGVQLISRDGTILYESPTVTRILGYLPEEMIGRKDSDFIHPDDLTPGRQKFGEMLRNGSAPTTTEARVRHKDGSWRWLEVVGMNLIDNPAMGAVVVNFRDITDRKLAQDALKSSEEQFRALIQNSHDVIYLISPDGDIRYASPSVFRKLGYAPEELFGRQISEFLSPEETERQAEWFADILLDPGSMRSTEFQFRHRNGSWKWMEATASNLGGPSPIHGMVLNLRDIEDRKFAESAIRKLNADLEQTVGERTLQLQEAIKELEAFSYSVSHDLRAPLRHIGGFADLLQNRLESNLDATGKRYLDVIGESVKRMDQLISHLLAFSRMSRQELQKTRFSMNGLVEKCVQDLEPECRGRQVEWEIADLPEANGDPTLIRQVLENLLSNAVKFTKNREVARISVGGKLEEGVTLYHVKDNGAGFDMKYYEKLFGVFQRLHGATQFEGSGIGLANVRRIMNRHGGKCWAEAEVDAGAVFYFSLPT